MHAQRKTIHWHCANMCVLNNYTSPSIIGAPVVSKIPGCDWVTGKCMASLKTSYHHHHHRGHAPTTTTTTFHNRNTDIRYFFSDFLSNRIKRKAEMSAWPSLSTMCGSTKKICGYSLRTWTRTRTARWIWTSWYWLSRSWASRSITRRQRSYLRGEFDEGNY